MAGDDVLFLGSAGCQPAVAGSLSATLGDAHILVTPAQRTVHLGKLPRYAGWQPALPGAVVARVIQQS